MAYYGLAYPTFAKLDTATNTYSNGFRMGKAVSINITINENEAKQAGDNITAEIVKEFKDGTIALGVTTIPIAAYNTVFGHKVTTTESSTTIEDKTDDLSNYVGVGIVKAELVDGVRSYIAIWIRKALFTETGESANTGGENITFQVPTINGTIIALADKHWRDRVIFNSEEAAIAYINDRAGITAKCTTPTSNVESDTYATAQTVTLTAGAGEAIHYTTNGTTPSATNGTLYSTPITVSASQGIKAIATKAGNSDSDISSFEYIITA